MERKYLIDLTLRGSEEDINYILKEIRELGNRRGIRIEYIRKID